MIINVCMNIIILLLLYAWMAMSYTKDNNWLKFNNTSSKNGVKLGKLFFLYTFSLKREDERGWIVITTQLN